MCFVLILQIYKNKMCFYLQLLQTWLINSFNTLSSSQSGTLEHFVMLLHWKILEDEVFLKLSNSIHSSVKGVYSSSFSLKYFASILWQNSVRLTNSLMSPAISTAGSCIVNNANRCPNTRASSSVGLPNKTKDYLLTENKNLKTLQLILMMKIWRN